MTEIIIQIDSDAEGFSDNIVIVRCKDCRWYRNYEGCFFSTGDVEPDGFCSYGERRK